jgi:hypothetical protein
VSKVLVFGHLAQTVAGRDLDVKRSNDDQHRHAHHTHAE